VARRDIILVGQQALLRVLLSVAVLTRPQAVDRQARQERPQTHLLLPMIVLWRCNSVCTRKVLLDNNQG
jgi:hypothetical protein